MVVSQVRVAQQAFWGSFFSLTTLLHQLLSFLEHFGAEFPSLFLLWLTILRVLRASLRWSWKESLIVTDECWKEIWCYITIFQQSICTHGLSWVPILCFVLRRWKEADGTDRLPFSKWNYWCRNLIFLLARHRCLHNATPRETFLELFRLHVFLTSSSSDCGIELKIFLSFALK